MRIGDILLEKGTTVVTIDTGRTIYDAIGMLNKHRIGALIVIEEGENAVGIITERDILRKCGGSMDGSSKPDDSIFSSLVEDVMTNKLIVGVPDDDPNYAMSVMTKNRIRHLPILDDGNLAGMVSIGDLVNAHLEEKIFVGQTLKNYLSRNDASEQA